MQIRHTGTKFIKILNKKTLIYLKKFYILNCSKTRSDPGFSLWIRFHPTGSATQPETFSLQIFDNRLKETSLSKLTR